ncbi:type IV pilus assembly protein FimV [Paucibacter soli]|uniref:type IV pilus assembly protein FimV n=1 Tax=Paucibacter soli TaxID=3133433 RepID=UPI0030AB303E
MLALLAGGSTNAHAVGVGRPLTLSALGQPLSLTFPLQLARGETLTRDCVRAEVLAGDARVPANLVQFQLEGEDEGSVHAVRLQTVVQIDEPLVSVNLALGCPVRFTRQYTAFIDPPGSAATSLPDAGGTRMPSAELREYSPALQAALNTSNAKPASLLAPQELAAAWAPDQAASAVAAPSKPRARRGSTAGSMVIDSQAAKSATPVKPRRSSAAARQAVAAAMVAAKAPKASGGRLSLEAPEALVESSSLLAANAASAASAAAEASERMVKLEQSFAKLQAEQGQTQDRLVAMRAQLEQAQRAQYSNPLSVALLTLCLALAGASVYLGLALRRERRQRDEAWWSGSKADASAAVAAPVAQAMPASQPAALASFSQAPDSTMPGALSTQPDERTMALPGLLDRGGHGVAGEQEPLSVQLISQGLVTQPAALHASGAAQAFDTQQRMVAVEELIDLEQQVDFFLVLGQEDAAVELLTERLDQAEGNGLPYLKLLEIHQRRGDHAAFDAVAERFAERFGARAPAWSEDLNEGRGLEAYPEVLQRLQANWHDAGVSMAAVQALLARDTLGEAGLDLPAYRDLLMLYAVARDISEHEVRGDDIDVFLPLDGSGGAAAAGAGMMATMVWQGTPQASAAIDVDISLDEPAAPPARNAQSS